MKEDCCVGKWINWAMERVRTFTAWDFAVFKVCLIAFGFLLGLAAGNRGKKHSGLAWVAFLGGYAALVWKMISGDTAKAPCCCAAGDADPAECGVTDDCLEDGPGEADGK